MTYIFCLRNNTKTKNIIGKFFEEEIDSDQILQKFEKLFEIPPKIDEDDGINVGELFDMNMKPVDRKKGKKVEDE